MKKVMTLGTFDLFHIGHLELLKFCHKLADGGSVIAVVNTDEFVERFKKIRPTIWYGHRLCIVGACRYVTMSIPNYGDERAIEVIRDFRPDIVVVGDDWKDRDYLGQIGATQEELDSLGVSIVYRPRTPDISSTEIRARLRGP